MEIFLKEAMSAMIVKLYKDTRIKGNGLKKRSPNRDVGSYPTPDTMFSSAKSHTRNHSKSCLISLLRTMTATDSLCKY